MSKAIETTGLWVKVESLFICIQVLSSKKITSSAKLSYEKYFGDPVKQKAGASARKKITSNTYCTVNGSVRLKVFLDILSF